jgi:hypothetical protein
MTAIWSQTPTGWSVLEPAGFADEASLHRLVEEAPQVVPLSGSPSLAILAREFVIGTGSADLLAVEPSGRLVIIEVKLAKNAEARRAVVAQVLAYAAFLKGTPLERLQQQLAPHLAKRDHGSLVEAVEQSVQDGSLDSAALLAGVAQSLETGQFRLVLVLDTAPHELVRLVGYLESIAPQLTIDLVTVSRYEVNGAPALVPQRVDPEREPTTTPGNAPVSHGARGQDWAVNDGGALFREAIDTLPPDVRPRALLLYEWAKDLEANGLAVLWSHQGPAYTTLAPRVRGYGAGLVTVVNDGTFWTWPTVFAKKAPRSIPAVEAALGGPLKQGGLVPEPSRELLVALKDAYVEAASLGPQVRERAG